MVVAVIVGFIVYVLWCILTAHIKIARLELKVNKLVKTIRQNHPQVLDGMEIEFHNGDKIKCVDGVWVDGKEE